MLENRRHTQDFSWMATQSSHSLVFWFLVSIVLHTALLAWMPKGLQPLKIQEFTEVEMTDLIAPKSPTVSPLLKSQSVPQANLPEPDTRDATSAAPIPQPIPTPSSISTPRPIPKSISSPIPTPTPSPTPRPIPKSISSPIPTPSSTSSPTSSPTESSSVVSDLFDRLGTGGSSKLNDKSPSPSLFSDPSLFFDEQAQLKSGILRAIAISGKTPSQIYIDILVKQGQKANFQSFEKGNYGTGTVYEVRQANNIWYFNLVPTQDTTGTIIVVWQRDPSRPIQ